METSSLRGMILFGLIWMVLIRAVPVVLAEALESTSRFHQLDPVEKNLQRISHSIVYMLAIGAVKFGGYWPVAVNLYAYMFDYTKRTEDWLNGFVIFGICVCCVRIRTGRRAFRFFNPAFHELTPVLRMRAIIKAAVGWVGLVYLTENHHTYIYAGGWWALAYNPLWLIAAWCALVGPIRLFLLRPRRADDAGGIVDGDIDRQRFDW